MRKALALFYFLAPASILAQAIRLTAFNRSECITACESPGWIFSERFDNSLYHFSFGMFKGCNDGDTLTESMSVDTLVLNLKTKLKRKIRNREGKIDTVYSANDYDCDCFYKYEIEISGLKEKPGFIKLNSKIFDPQYGFIHVGEKADVAAYLASLTKQYAFEAGQETKVKDPGFEFNDKHYKGRNTLDDLASFLHYRQTLRVEFMIDLSCMEKALPGHEKLSLERAESLIHFLDVKRDICPTRLVYKGEILPEKCLGQNNPEEESGLWIKLVDTGSAVFPKYEEKRGKD